MPRTKGTPKTGGRKKGTPNRRTRILREVLGDLGFDVVKRLHELLPQLKEDKQAQVLLELLSYLYPKRKAVEVSGEGGGPVKIQSMTSEQRQQRIEELIEKRELVRSSPD